MKRKLKFQHCKNCFKTSEIINKVNYLEKKEINVDFLKENQRKFEEKNKLVLKTLNFNFDFYFSFKFK